MAAAITPTTVSAQESKSVKEVATAVEQLRQAMIGADGSVLDKLTSDSLSYGHSGGTMQNKQEFIKSFTSGASVFVTIDITGQHITVVGNTATVRHILSAKTNDAGKGPGTVKLGILLVWIKSKTGWQLLARQAVKVV
nr:nuclear transport factor 2 family protein [Mucilaginibacter sp. FT3.2]MBB6231535.1 ketosteroid isomerase-like protein [Mucilaginibacter sp. FT3.2]